MDFWPFLKSQKMEFGQKYFFREIDLFDFTSFFCLDIFKLILFSVLGFGMGMSGGNGFGDY